MANPLDMQRSYAIVGTGGCGKTSLAEMLLFDAGAINRMGAIEEGTTCLDYEPEEIRRRGSIQPGVATFLWNKNRHFLLDIPGDGNFTGDLEYLLKGVDSVLFVIDAVDGVRPLTKRFWNHIREENLPTLIVVNKMDRDRANFSMAIESLGTLGIRPVVLQLPIMEGGVFTGYVDVLAGLAHLKKFIVVRDSHPEEFKEQIAKGHLGIPCFVVDDKDVYVMMPENLDVLR